MVLYWEMLDHHGLWEIYEKLQTIGSFEICQNIEPLVAYNDATMYFIGCKANLGCLNVLILWASAGYQQFIIFVRLEMARDSNSSSWSNMDCDKFSKKDEWLDLLF